MTIDTLYFDGNCDFCSARAVRLQQLAGLKLRLININELAADNNLPGPLALRRELHLKTASGHWLTGMAAVLQACSHTRYAPIFSLLALPGINSVATVCYEALSLRRYRKLYGCEACED
jgi:predicted DCC family thiol-disulfide oxidoreductase YuxK